MQATDAQKEVSILQKKARQYPHKIVSVYSTN